MPRRSFGVCGGRVVVPRCPHSAVQSQSLAGKQVLPDALPSTLPAAAGGGSRRIGHVIHSF